MKNNNSLNKQLFLVLPVVSILIVIGIGLIWIQPRVVTIFEKQDKLKEEEERQTRLETKLTKLNQLSQDKTTLLANLTAVNVALPTQKDVPGLIIQLQQIAQESDVSIQGIQLAPGKLLNDSAPASKTGPEIVINSSIKGNYEAIKTFLGKIYKAKRLINMESISLTTGGTDDTGALTVSIIMNTYYQPLPARPGDASEEVPMLTPSEKALFEKLQSYTSYQSSSSPVKAQPKTEATTSASPVSSEAPETSGSAKSL